jgi:hypothetical protein
MHAVRSRMSHGRSRNGSLGRLQSRSDRLITSDRGLRWLQALRNGLPDGLPQHPGVPGRRNDPQHGSGVLKNGSLKKFSLKRSLIRTFFHSCGFNLWGNCKVRPIFYGRVTAIADRTSERIRSTMELTLIRLKSSVYLL